jgi:hypothetical protein
MRTLRVNSFANSMDGHDAGPDVERVPAGGVTHIALSST